MKLNKIVVNEDYLSVDDNILWLDVGVREVTLNIKGRVIINDLNSFKNEKIKIIMEENSNLIYNKFSLSKNYEEIKISGNKNSRIEFNYGILTEKESKIVVNYEEFFDGGECVINVKGVARGKGKLEIEANGLISKNTKDNEYLENIRILTENDQVHIIKPNLMIDTCDVVASHNATISSFNNDWLFYLMSKGIKKKEAELLISRGFILSCYRDLEFVKEISKNLN